MRDPVKEVESFFPFSVCCHFLKVFVVIVSVSFQLFFNVIQTGLYAQNSP